MTDQTIPQSITTTQLKFVDGPNYNSFYCNNIGYTVNQLDVVLYLNEMLDVSSDGVGTVERRARVTFNPMQAKALVGILQHLVKIYETQSGHPIPEMEQQIITPKVGNES